MPTKPQNSKITPETSSQVDAMVIRHNNKQYRCLRKSRSNTDCGQWEFYYPLPNGNNWHDVKNRDIRHELNKILNAV